MSDFTHLVIVLPCHSMEDFPTHYYGAEAENLLAYWTALWHPALVATVQRLPQWQSADFCEPSWRGNECVWDSAYHSDHDHADQAPLDDVSAEADSQPTSLFPLVVVPQVSDPIVSTDLLMLADQDGLLITEPTSRSQIAAEAFRSSPMAADFHQKIDLSIAEDFFALGYAFLQVQMMTRQLRYSSNLNEREFEQSVVAAAKAAVGSADDQQQRKVAEDLLTACFDLLLEEKNAYYPVEPQLCDVVLTANSTIGKSLTRELDQICSPINLLITGETAKKLKAQSPDTHSRIQSLVRSRVSRENEMADSASAEPQNLSRGFNGEVQSVADTDASITLIGGLESELPDWLLNNESIKNQLQMGVQTIEDVFQTRPAIFMRRTFGVSPSLPGILGQMEFDGAIHATLGQGVFPQSPNGVIRWTGCDDASILAIGDQPINASDSGSFLGLGVKIGEMIDSAHMASVVFVRWPSQGCQSLQDLRRVNHYCSLFGNFIGLDDYFASLYDPGYGESYQADEYRLNYLKAAIEARQVDPISRFSRFHARHARIEVCRRLLVLSIDFEKQISGSGSEGSSQSRQIQQLKTHLAEADRLQSEAESVVGLADEALIPSIDDQIDLLWQTCETMFLTHTGWKRLKDAKEGVTARAILNLLSSKQATHVRFEANRGTPVGTLKPKSEAPKPGSGAAAGKALLPLADQTASTCDWVVEVPATGNLVIDCQSVEKTNRFKGTPSIAADLTLQNEFFVAGFDQETGGIRNVNFHNQRLNLFTQQLAIRTPGKSRDSIRSPARYTNMVSDSIEVVDSNSLSGAIRSTGTLNDGDNVLCEFVQTVRIVRGISRLDFEVELKPRIEFQTNPNHYLCLRLAWKDEGARIVANCIDTAQPVASEWIHATRFVTIGDAATFTLLTDGLPFHRRANRRMLDTVLIAAGETQTSFRFSIDVNQKYGLLAAAARMMPPLSFQSPDGNSKSMSWLLHFDCRNVLASRIEPLIDEGRVVGLRVRLHETEGRTAKLKIRCRYRFAAGNQVYFNSGADKVAGVIGALDVDDKGRAAVELGRFAFAEFNLYFAL